MLKDIWLLQSTSDIKRSVPVVFAMLFNESAHYLSACINNFILYVDDGILIINLPEVTLNKFRAQLGEEGYTPLNLGERVFFVVSNDSRQHWGATLMLGHLYSYIQAKLYFEFEYFCTLASNSLFVKKFDLKLVNDLLDEAPSRLMKPESYPESTQDRRSFPAFRSLLSPDVGGLYANEIEGFYSSSKNWEIMLNYRNNLEYLEKCYSKVEHHVRLAIEEFFPAMVVCGLGDRKYINIHRRLFLENGYGPPIKRYATVRDIFAIDRMPGVCGLKWFHRSSVFPATEIITNPNLNNLWEPIKVGLNSLSLNELLNFKTVLTYAVQEVESRLLGGGIVAVNLMADWGDQLFEIEIQEKCYRQVKPIHLNKVLSTFLFYELIEGVQPSIKISVKPTNSGASLSISCKTDADFMPVSSNTENLLVAFWYLPFPPMFESKRVQIKIRIEGFCPHNDQENSIFKHCVFCLRGQFILTQAISCYGNEYVFICDPFEVSDEIDMGRQTFLGLPIHMNTSFAKMVVEFIEYAQF